jgi:hypothetical protein
VSYFPILRVIAFSLPTPLQSPPDPPGVYPRARVVKYIDSKLSRE